MAVTHNNPTRSLIADLVSGELNGGTLEYQTGGSVLVAAGALSADAAPPAVAGVATFNPIGDATNGTGGTLVVAQFVMKSSLSAEVLYGSVTTAGLGGDIQITDTSIADGVPITTSSLTYTAAP